MYMWLTYNLQSISFWRWLRICPSLSTTSDNVPLVPVPEGWNPSIAVLPCSDKQTNTKHWVLKLPCQNISATSSSFSLVFSSWHMGVVFVCNNGTPGYYLRPSSLLHIGLLHIGFLIIMLMQFKTSHCRQDIIAFISELLS